MAFKFNLGSELSNQSSLDAVVQEIDRLKNRVGANEQQVENAIGFVKQQDSKYAQIGGSKREPFKVSNIRLGTTNDMTNVDGPVLYYDNGLIFKEIDGTTLQVGSGIFPNTIIAKDGIDMVESNENKLWINRTGSYTVGYQLAVDGFGDLQLSNENYDGISIDSVGRVTITNSDGVAYYDDSLTVSGGAKIGYNLDVNGGIFVGNEDLKATTYAQSVIAHKDAGLDLISKIDGSWGSLLSLVESVNSTTLTDAWAISRNTSTAGSDLHFKYGTSINSNDNPSLVNFMSDGKVGVGTNGDDVKANLEVRTTRSLSLYDDITGILIDGSRQSSSEACIVFRNSESGVTNQWYTGLNQSNDYDIANGDTFTAADVLLKVDAVNEVVLLPRTNVSDIANSTGKAVITRDYLHSTNTESFYHEGTWTPSLVFGGVYGGVTYSARHGSYTKVGNLVTINFNIILTSKGTNTGNTTIIGLPFPIKEVLDETSLEASGTCGYAVGFTGLIGTINLVAHTTNGITLYCYTSGGVLPVLNTNFGNTTSFRGSITYVTD